jgi:hypothetical protein
MLRSKRAGVTEVVPDCAAFAVCSGQHHVEKPHRFSKRLKGGAALADAAIGPGKQNANAISCESAEKGFSLPIVRKLWRFESQKSRSCKICVRSLERGLKSIAFATASGISKFRAEGQPSARGRKVSQIFSRVRRWRGVRFKVIYDHASVSQFLLFFRSSAEAPFFKDSLEKRASGKPGLNLQVL